MSSENNSKSGKDSAANLMRLFQVQSNHHVVTRQDLMRDYNSGISERSLNSDDNDDNDDQDDNDNITAINNYYTWNSSKTNASIYKERAAILSALHSAESMPMPASRSSSRPSASKSFTRSHRIQDIVAMCSDERNAFSADEYHNNETVNADDWPPAAAAASQPDHSGWSGLRRTTPYCGSTAASTTDGSSDVGDEPGGRNVAETAAEATSRQHQTPGPAVPPPRPSSKWERAFGFFRKK